MSILNIFEHNKNIYSTGAMNAPGKYHLNNVCNYSHLGLLKI